MEIKKYKVDGKEYIFVENIKIGFLKLYRCISNTGENVFLKGNNKLYKKINNKLLLDVLNSKYTYRIKTDICESDNGK